MENFYLRPLQWWAESAPLGWYRVKVSENLDATAVALVAPVVTSLNGKAGKAAVLEGWAEILLIFGWHFGRNDDLINSF